MTVSSTTTRVTYTGNGVTLAFATTFPFFDASEIEVVERVIATGAETVKTLTTHYTVAGGSGSTGTVTAIAAPASTVQWVLRRRTARTQAIDYTPNDPFPAETHEQGLDRLKMNVQEIGEELDRSLKYPRTDSASLSAELPPSVDRAGKFLTFDSSGEPTVSAGSADSLTVSPFVATLLDDADAAAARSTLGISSTGLDITGLTALTAPAIDDELPVYDLSALANRKITLADLFKVINVLAAETAPAIDDVLALYDTSAGTTDRISLANILKVVNGLTEDTTPDAAADFVLTYDTSAAAVKKAKPANLGSGGISSLSVVPFTGNGTWTKPAGVKYLRVCCVGGGGGGGGVSSAAGGTAGGGGGGGYAEKIIDVSALATGATYAVAVGGSGAGGAITPTNGTAGGDTTFNSTVCVGKGGSGGLQNGTAGAGGVAGTGDFTVPGEAGDNGSGAAAIAVYYKTGAGGNAALGFGHGARIPDTENGAAGTGYGGGGSGASDGDGSGQSGGAGAAGICIVYEYK